MSASVDPILDDDVLSAAAFLHQELNPRLTTADWASAIATTFSTTAPHHGFILRDGQDVHGILLTFFSERTIGGRTEAFCNLGAWCVRSDKRFHGLRLLQSALRMPGYHFTDLSPSGSVLALNEKLGFRRLDTTSSVLPCVPRASRSTVITDLEASDALVRPEDRAIFQGHRSAAGAHHVVLRSEEHDCYVIYRLERRKGLRVFATVLHVSDADQFRPLAPALASHLLSRHGTVALILEHRVTGTRSGTIPLSRTRPKMFKSSTLEAEDIDYLYSELCAVPW